MSDAYPEPLEPEDWDLERLQEEYAELALENNRNRYEAEKQNRRRGYYVSSIAPLVRTANVDHAAQTATIPLSAWQQFCDDLAAISYGRAPARCAWLNGSLCDHDTNHVAEQSEESLVRSSGLQEGGQAHG